MTKQVNKSMTAPLTTTAPHPLTYHVPRYRISLVQESTGAPDHIVVRDSATAAQALRPLFDGLDREHFIVCALDAKHAMIGVNVVSIGSLTLSVVHPREVFKPILLMNACALICAHNHPSGDPTPSPEDRALTARLKQAGDFLGVTLLDHLILADGRSYSFADAGWPG